jgi:hypothetical protein
VTAAERRRLMDRGAALRARARALHAEDRTQEAFALEDEGDRVNQRYRELLPDVPVARCPHSGALVSWPIDTMGLDAWFWNYLRPIRRTPESLPPAWLAMAGAMRLAEPVEHPPFAVVPGPDVPFVVPEILGADGVRAVVTEIPVGRHTGWAISYFGPKPRDVPLINVWGVNTYPVYDDDGTWHGWAQERPRVARYDFDLTRWLRSGKLLWIEPGDESMALREDPGDCPFTDLPGQRRITVIANGVVRHLAAFAGHGAG